MKIVKSIKGFFEDNRKELVKRFLSDELDTMNGEIIRQAKYLNSLQRKRERLEIMVYGS